MQIPSARGVMQVKEGTSGVMRVPWPLSAFKAKQSSRCKARSPSRPKSRSRWGQFGHWSRQHRRLARLLQATASHTLRARPSQYYGVMRLAVAMQLTRLMATRMGLKPFTISDLSTCSILVG